MELEDPEVSETEERQQLAAALFGSLTDSFASQVSVIDYLCTGGQTQGPYRALKVLKSLEFDWTKFKALESLNFSK